MRSTRGLSLTEPGRNYYERCRTILADIEEAEQSVSAEHMALRGTMRITVPVSFGLLHLARLLHRFMRRHPDLDFNIDLSDRTVDLIEEGIDLAIRVGQLTDRD